MAGGYPESPSRQIVAQKHSTAACHLPLHRLTFIPCPILPFPGNLPADRHDQGAISRIPARGHLYHFVANVIEHDRIGGH